MGNEPQGLPELPEQEPEAEATVWVRTADRLPEEGQWVAIVLGSNCFDAGYFMPGERRHGDAIINRGTVPRFICGGTARPLSEVCLWLPLPVPEASELLRSDP